MCDVIKPAKASHQSGTPSGSRKSITIYCHSAHCLMINAELRTLTGYFRNRLSIMWLGTVKLVFWKTG